MVKKENFENLAPTDTPELKKEIKYYYYAGLGILALILLAVVLLHFFGTNVSTEFLERLSTESLPSNEKSSKPGFSDESDVSVFGTYPLFPYEYGELYGIWMFKSIQPQVSGFESQEGANYLLVSLKGKTIRVFVTGSLAGVTLENTSYSHYAVPELVDFEFLKRNVAVGDVIRIDYLASYPDVNSRTVETCAGVARLCTIAALMDSMGLKLYTEDLESNLSNVDVLPALQIHRELIE